MANDFVRIGRYAINLSNVVKIDIEALEVVSDTGQHVAVTYINGETDTFTGDVAQALIRWVEDIKPDLLDEPRPFKPAAGGTRSSSIVR